MGFVVGHVKEGRKVIAALERKRSQVNLTDSPPKKASDEDMTGRINRDGLTGSLGREQTE